MAHIAPQTNRDAFLYCFISFIFYLFSRALYSFVRNCRQCELAAFPVIERIQDLREVVVRIEIKHFLPIEFVRLPAVSINLVV